MNIPVEAFKIVLQHIADISRDGYTISRVLRYPNTIEVLMDHSNGNQYSLALEYINYDHLNYVRAHNNEIDFTKSWQRSE